MKRNGSNRAMMASKAQMPRGWRLVRLGDMADVLDARRIPLNAEDRSKMPGEYPYYGANGVIDFIDRWIFDEDDDLVLLAEDGGHFDEFRNRPIAFRVEGKCWVNNHAHVLKATTCTVGGFLFHSLVNKDIRLYINGTTRSKLTQADLLQVEVSLPPLPVQRAIAAVLDSIDDAIERTAAVIAATEQLRDSLLHQLLTRGVPGWHTAWKEVPGLGTMPADWDVVSLGEVIGSTTYGTNIQLGRDGAVAVLRMNNLQGGELDLRDVRRADLSEKESNDLSLVPGDILFNRTNSRDLVGKVAIVRDLEQPVSFASYLIRLRAAKTRANPYWLVALLGSSQCQDRIRKFATPGVSQANINPTNLKSLTISLPSLAEQQTVARVLDGADATLVRVRQERARLQRVKDSTSDVLLTGQVRAMA